MSPTPTPTPSACAPPAPMRHAQPGMEPCVHASCRPRRHAPGMHAFCMLLHAPRHALHALFPALRTDKSDPLHAAACLLHEGRNRHSRKESRLPALLRLWALGFPSFSMNRAEEVIHCGSAGARNLSSLGLILPLPAEHIPEGSEIPSSYGRLSAGAGSDSGNGTGRVEMGGFPDEPAARDFPVENTEKPVFPPASARGVAAREGQRRSSTGHNA